MDRLYDFFVRAGVCAKTEYPLSGCSGFRIGGNAKLALFPGNREEMLLALETVASRGMRFLVIGNASNVVFSDDGFDGVVIFTGAWRACTLEDGRMQVSAGTSLLTVATEAKRAGLSGVEFAYGIPGTLGGAVFMNAGAFGGSVSDVCETSEYFDTVSGKIGVFSGAEQRFGNRTSIYATNPHYAILGATLVLHPDEETAIDARMRDYLARRRATQPLEYPSAGSVFKRPEGHFAGKLIEDCGLKGTRIGGAEVSLKHAGFIINRGGATARDVRELTELIQKRVEAEFGVSLECEIRFL